MCIRDRNDTTQSEGLHYIRGIGGTGAMCSQSSIPWYLSKVEPDMVARFNQGQLIVTRQA